VDGDVRESTGDLPVPECVEAGVQQAAIWDEILALEARVSH
jgi:hypothetical protein